MHRKNFATTYKLLVNKLFYVSLLSYFRMKINKQKSIHTYMQFHRERYYINYFLHSFNLNLMARLCNSNNITRTNKWKGEIQNRMAPIWSPNPQFKSHINRNKTFPIFHHKEKRTTEIRERARRHQVASMLTPHSKKRRPLRFPPEDPVLCSS